MGYVVVAPLVYLKVPDAAGAFVSSTFYAGSPVPDGVDKDSLQHHLDNGLVVKTGDPVAEVFGVPAGTPIPDEPPNVEVTEVPVSAPLEERAAAVQKAAESQTRRSSSSSSKK